MPDGVRLAARVWRPKGVGPFPAILEYIPYRKRDMVRARDERNHPYFADHGYVCLRVDIRGSGDSEGQMPDMYSTEELSDARHVIEWIARQNWCSGRVGMFGTSWGGTASLQAAVNAPEPLKAVLANCATANRFEDDIHWMGGALLTDSFEWGATLPAILAAPPDRATVGEQWFERWQARLQALTYPLDSWIRHRSRGQYWRHGSIIFNTQQLTCPILAVGGWADRYSNSVMGLVSQRPDLAWGVVGPWGHHYPDQGEPGPAISFQDLAVNWWDHWLKDTPNSKLNWPRLRIWRREFEPPQNRLTQRRGAWIELARPDANQFTALYLTDDGLCSENSSESQIVDIPNDLRHGECAGDTGYFGRPGGLPLDQLADDARSLCFESKPLTEDFELVGHTQLIIDIARDRSAAQLVCRLCEVAPDGTSNLVVRQLRSLALSESLDTITPGATGEFVRYQVNFPSTAYRFTQGNRIRLALGTSYWPLAWPELPLSRLRVLTGNSHLRLAQNLAAKPLSTPFVEPKKRPVHQDYVIESAGELQRHQEYLDNGQVDYCWDLPRVTFRFAKIGVAISLATTARYKLDTNDTGTVRFSLEHNIEICRSDGTARIESSLTSKADSDGMTVAATLTAYWDTEVIESKSWRLDYPQVPDRLNA